ncbi:MAG: dipeptide epimerase [Chloroflexi bacterium]|nr:dipeptide epimerase [Chloroflexota bacterium]
MQITSVKACPANLPYRKPWGISSGIADTAQHVLVKITTDDGDYGLGEATPFPIGYAYETQDSILHIIRDFLRPVLIGQHPFNLERIESSMARAVPGHPLAKAGIDIALYDLMGKILKVPVYYLLGGAVRTRVPLGYSIGIKSTAEMVQDAVHFVASGFAAIKVKIGAGPRVDLEHVAAVRDAIGPDIKLRVDANEAYRWDEALPMLRKLERYDLEYIEQPVPRWDLDGMSRLCAALDTPVMADESAFTPEDVIALIKFRAADMLNVEPCKSGLAGAKRIAAIAEAAGLSCTVGSMLEMGLGTAAHLHFACATRSVSHACELIAPLLFTGDILADPIFSQEPPDGHWDLLSGPGLGVTLDKRWMSALSDD